jgi:hypothetical protein
MAQFISYDPNVEVTGAGVLSIVAALGADISPVLTLHGLASLKPDGWYPQQNWLNVLKAIHDRKVNAMFDLVSVGMKIPDKALFPPEINSIPSALLSLDVAYHMNHRGGEIGHYQARCIADNHIDVICDAPYPCDFDYGIIYGMVRRFRSAGAQFTVRHQDPGTCRQRGDNICTYHVTWEESLIPKRTAIAASQLA